jgi:Transglycosylase-like domain
MKRLIVPVGVAVAAVARGVAAAKSPPPAHARAYEKAYREVSHKFGPRVPGRNILKDGIRAHRSVTDAQTVASLQVLERILAPALSPATSATSAVAPAATSATTGSTAGAGGVPACASESGTNYSTGGANTDASSGATGRYQILPSTAAAYGCSLATAAGQDACAQTIYEHQGASAWVGCGG